MAGARLPALDGIRGLAILMVVTYHFIFVGIPYKSSVIWNAALGAVSTGWLGVDLFFVLSGFLITGILYDAKGSSNYFRVFYARRALRIFPLYFAVLATYALILPRVWPHDPESTAFLLYQPWFWGYASNVLNSLNGPTGLWLHAPFHTTVLWSLAVEEQFYLIWPLLILVIPQSKLVKSCVALAGAALIIRCTLVVTGLGAGAVMLMPARMDAFALGGLVAVSARRGGLEALRRQAPLIMTIALALLIAIWSSQGGNPHEGLARSDVLMRTIGFSAVAVFFAGAIVLAITEKSGAWNRLGLNPVLRWFGAYSYGLYLLHAAVLTVMVRTPLNGVRMVQAGMSWPKAIVITSLVGMSLSVLAAYLSWQCFEGPINNLKRHFPYQRAIPLADTPSLTFASSENSVSTASN